MTVKILNLSHINKGFLKCSFDVELPKIGLTLKGCSMFSKDNRAWIAYPQKEVVKDGEKKYFPQVIWSKERKEALDKMIIDIIKFNPEFQPQNSVSRTEPVFEQPRYDDAEIPF